MSCVSKTRIAKLVLVSVLRNKGLRFDNEGITSCVKRKDMGCWATIILMLCNYRCPDASAAEDDVAALSNLPDPCMENKRYDGLLLVISLAI